ncbi:hypothetical protein J1614_009538 [Plenodomus biglobosus]|nr:hypothetical protein J1614_009538 [Plenodomus biglobosus]
MSYSFYWLADRKKRSSRFYWRDSRCYRPGKWALTGERVLVDISGKRKDRFVWVEYVQRLQDEAAT